MSDNKEIEAGNTFQEQPAMREVDAEGVDIEAVLKDFRNSIHAWSDATLSRPRMVKAGFPRRNWRLATAWALGCILATGAMTGGVLERHHRQELARIAVEQKAAADRKQLEEQQARATVSDEVLLAGVDSDVSRDVPSAMEPLAQLMADDGTK